MATFLSFNRSETKSKEIYNELIGNCEEEYLTNFLSDPKYFPTNSPKKWKFKFSKDVALLKAGDTLELINVAGFQDNIMVEAAHKYTLPRGLKILKLNGSYISYGFYPKFSNDPDRQDKITVPENTNKLEFFQKYSGFLGLLFGFIHDGDKYLIATSKNSASNEFSENAKEIIQQNLNDDLIDVLCNSNKTLGFEIMSKKDQTHGSLVYNEAAIITCISETNGKSLNYYTLDEVIDFAKTYNLPFSTLYSIEGTQNIDTFCRLLFETRDTMTNKSFNDLIESMSCIQTIQGQLTHQNILGNVLEGLVFHFYDNATKSTVKIKFPNYIIRTMVLRTAFRKLQEEPEIAYNLTETIVPRWVMSKETEQFWKSFCYLCFEEYTENPMLYNEDSSSHIIIANKIYDYMLSKYNTIENAIKINHGYFEIPNDHIAISMEDFKTMDFDLDKKYMITTQDNVELKFQASIVKNSDDPKTILYLMSGIPGTGKTTIATHISNRSGIQMFAADDFFKNTGIEYDFRYLLSAHKLCQYNTSCELAKGNSVIVHNTSTTLHEMRPYFTMGFDKIIVIRPTTQFQSLHNIDTKIIDNMKKRLIPLHNIKYDNVVKINEKKNNKALQVRIYVNENYHITLEYYREYSHEIIDKWLPFVGSKVELSYGEILCHQEENRHLETLCVNIQGNPSFEISKPQLHITLRAENIEPAKSNDLLGGKLTMTSKLNYNETSYELPNIGTVVLYC